MIPFRYILITILMLSTEIFSQEKASLQLVKETRSDAICLRWAVDAPLAWQKSNTIGFRLERFTVLRDGKLLSTPERLDLGTFMVPKLEVWQSLVEQNDNAAIVAQAIYGEDFQVAMSSNQNAIEGIVNKAKEIEQRFSFALMAADLDFEVARFAGWGYVDKQVKKNEKYFYKIHLLPNEKLSLEAGSVMASLQEYEPLPTPLDFNAFFQDQKVLLTWDYKTLSSLYSYYFLEKAEGKTDFKPVSELPVVNMNQGANASSMVYIDSLSQNDKEFSYRLRGKTIFGSYSPYTEIVSGKGIKSLSIAAQLSKIQTITDNQYRIMWNFPKENENEITHFALLHSANDKEYRIVKDEIPVSERSVVHSLSTPSNYYKIRTFGRDGSQQDSFAMLVQPEDDTPPLEVQQLTGTIDSLGVVRLQWKANAEADLMGYYVFRANQKEEEMMRITGSHITDTYFTDTLSLKNLNKKIFYTVTAIDFRKNESSRSEILELTKPDKIPPSTPIFTEYEQEKNHWKITWQQSFDDDVTHYHLYRKEKETTQWHKIHSEKHSHQESYTYKEPATLSGTYVYSLRAEDRSGNFSEYAPVIHIHHNPLTDTRVLRGLNSRVGQGKIELRWDKLKVAISEIVIYKAIKGEKPTLWRSFSQPVTSAEDTDIAPDTTYQYLIKVILQDQSPTPTEKIEVFVKEFGGI
ncbi:hypothetical protein [Capnocytophaga canimorsus]|uniref:hypothetical protein n=1 Tax=Capnocytophaga canimorsus TaxID=28188 RepID=UPI0037D12612